MLWASRHSVTFHSLDRVLQEFAPAQSPGGAVDTGLDDWIAERVGIDTVTELAHRYRLDIVAVGEEGLKVGTFRPPGRVGAIVALLDMLDGTHLRRRDLSNWCSALVFYLPASGEVLASLVGHAVGTLYYAARAGGAFKQEPDPGALPMNQWLLLGTPAPIRASGGSASSAHLAFFGQKPGAFLRAARHRRLLGRMERIYNLGGNPMLAKVADGSMDAVVEFPGGGQLPHDCVPGAFIVDQAGGTVMGLDGRPLDWREALLDPSSRRLSYVAAGRGKTAAEIIRWMA